MCLVVAVGTQPQRGEALLADSGAHQPLTSSTGNDKRSAPRLEFGTTSGRQASHDDVSRPHGSGLGGSLDNSGTIEHHARDGAPAQGGGEPEAVRLEDRKRPRLN